MKTNLFLLFIIMVILSSCTSKDTLKKPPLAKTDPVIDEYFGVKITDSYRYMENLKDTSVQSWMNLQADYAREILDKIPGRQKLIDKMNDFDNRKSTEVTSLRITDNDRYFYLKTAPDDETGKLFYRDGFEGQEVLLFDPEKYDSDTTKKYVISSITPSWDGSKVAFDVSPNGSENAVLMIMNVKDIRLYSEKIQPRSGGFPVSWTWDNNSILYSRLQTSDKYNIDRLKNSKTCLHSIGTDPASDREIFSGALYPELNIEPEELPFVEYDKETHLLLSTIFTVDNRLNMYYAPESELNEPKISWKRLFKPEDEVYGYATTTTDIYIYTANEAPNFKIMKITLANPEITKAEVIIPEDPARTLSEFSLTSDGLFYILTENGVKDRMFLLPYLEKIAKEVDPPFNAGFIGLKSKGPGFSDIWINVTGWTRDAKRYRYLPKENRFNQEMLSSVAEYPEYKELIVEELMIPSHDGVLVPLSLIYNKNLQKTGKNVVLIKGYGAYGISELPKFEPNQLLWTHNGGILAVAHVRGGGELGDKWHRGGYKTTKPNTWKDLIACAEYLVKEKYTSPQKIAIFGRSAGGILIGRAMTERPDLFAVAIPGVGSLNAVRMEEEPGGPVNAPEFGTVKDSVECMALIEMDAYAHIKNGVNYPATLITAGINDPRVIAWQPAKFAARLEAANASDKPILFLTDFEAGHGIGNTKKKDFESLADIISFALWQVSHPDFQIK